MKKIILLLLLTLFACNDIKLPEKQSDVNKRVILKNDILGKREREKKKTTLRENIVYIKERDRVLMEYKLNSVAAGGNIEKDRYRLAIQNTKGIWLVTKQVYYTKTGKARWLKTLFNGRSCLTVFIWNIIQWEYLQSFIAEEMTPKDAVPTDENIKRLPVNLDHKMWYVYKTNILYGGIHITPIPYYLPLNYLLIFMDNVLYLNHNLVLTVSYDDYSKFMSDHNAVLVDVNRYSIVHSI